MGVSDAMRAVIFGLLIASLAPFACATEPAAGPPASAAVPLAPPAGSQRLPGSVACESEVSCSACAEDSDKELVHTAPLLYAADVRGCYDQVAKTHVGTEGRVVVRFGIDPTGVVGTSCVVRSSLNDTTLDRCLADLVLRWKFPAPKSGGWALVDHAFVFGP
jgi:TonB family protein